MSLWLYSFLPKAFLDKRDAGPGDFYLKFMETWNEFRVHLNKGETGEQPIFCDGSTMTVQSNLYEALLCLRRLPPADYWIDAFCINQEDLTERSEQV
jgi:hypothetical protein